MTNTTGKTPEPAARVHPIATLFPGYFALVMATGIIAIGAKQQKIDWLANSLYVVAAGAFAVLVVLFVARLALYPKRLAADLTSHAKGFSFLTIVAGTNVLASASAVVHGWWTLAEFLWWCSLPLYVILLYTALTSAVLRHDKPGLGAGINGSWFLLTVATESVAVFGALLLGHHPSDFLAFMCIAAFCLGLVLYLIVMTMVFLRWTFQPLEPTEADPPAWIAAGAVAITVLAGSNLLAARTVSARSPRTAHRRTRHTRLGHRHVLVPGHGRDRCVAPHRLQGSAALSPLVLGARVPARHVRRRHLQNARRHQTRPARMGAQDHLRRGAHRMDRSLHRPRRPRRPSRVEPDTVACARSRPPLRWPRTTSR